jgi:hypothetical protein
VKHPDELDLILELQKSNLAGNISPQEALEQGFLTIAYTKDTLQRFHDATPAIVARHHEQLAGYTLATPRHLRQEESSLAMVFDMIDQLHYRGQNMAAVNYILCGQLCVAAPFRGLSIPDRLYQCFRECYASQYSMLATEIAVRNTRSLRVHERTGFEVAGYYTDELQREWAVVIWDWLR